ncbi:MAG TPA: radical SAM protein [bacterium]|nr:radical SAM protein [bacterium]
MSVLLINPRALDSSAARILTPPLGLAYLSASLQARGIEARVLDADALDLVQAELVEHVKRLTPRIVGVTGMTPIMDAAYRTLEAVRPLTPVLVLGGPHASAVGRKVFDESPVRLDYVVCGEAEESFAELVKKILEGDAGAAEGIAGVLAPGDTNGNERPVIPDLDALPFPDRDSLPAGRYRHPLWGRQAVTTMITSRGCPYRCIFCDKHTCGSKWRARSAGNVLAEMEEIVKRRGVRRIMIYDDLFTLQRDRVIEICRGIIERGLQFKWKCEGRVNRVDAETLSWMKRAGCDMIAYGVETATERGLKFLQKDITVDQAREAFALTRAAGIQTLGYFLLGIPGETMEDEMETVRLAIELRADYAQFGVLSAFPGTPLYDYAMERGWVREAPARGPAERGRRAVIMDGYWTMERIDKAARDAHRKFYFRPRYLIQRFKGLRSFSGWMDGAMQGGRLLSWWLKSSVKRG